MSALAEAARYGSSEAQNLVAQFFDAHGVEVPEDLPICDWLEPRALDYTPGAAKTLEAIDPERYENIISKQRSTTDTSVGLCSFSIGGVENLILKYPHETRSLIEEIDTITRNAAGLNLIHMAAASGHLSVIRSLLESGLCDHEVRDSYGKTALYHACRNGHRDIALLLLSQYSTADGRPFSDKQELIDTCFHSMISFYSNDMLEVATFLMRLPGSINKSPGDGSVLLQRALMYNNVEAVRILLGYGEQRTYSEILMATSLRCSEILYLFLYDMAEKEGPLDASMLGKLMRFAAVTQDTFMSIQLHGYKHTSAVISTVETIEYFIQLWYPQPNLIIETVKCQIFNEASIARRLDTLQLVLDPFFKSYIRLASKMWDSVLLLPLVLGDTGMFDLFLENGAAEYNDNHTFEHGRYRGIPFRTLDNLFSTAIQSSNPFFIRRLLDVGIWLDEDRLHKAAILPDEAKHYCPFQLAVLKTCYDTATFLAKHTKQIETKTISWNVFIAYMIPTQLNLGFTMLDYLINLKGIPTPLPNSDGSTVLHYLSTLYAVDPDSRRSRLRKFWAEIMVRFRDQIDIQTLEGRTALDSAISQHNILMVEALIEAGADLNILNEDGLTTLDKLLIARSIAVLRVNPKLPPRIESHTKRRKPLDRMSFLGPVADRGPVLDLDAAMFPIDSKDPLSRDYHGDSFDERLCQIYTMLRSAGGESVLFPHPLACTERLENWTSMWINIRRESSQQPKGEAREVIDQLVRVWGHQLRIPHADVLDSFDSR
ncbi:ankyrin repeat-containing domain protein [Morchella snyderi]|nr:ankyrin repeat-containing domain protein [Morchella snyderi]